MTTAARRSVTIPLYFLMAAASPLLLCALPVLGVVDGVRRNRWATVRATLFVCVYAICEAIGMSAAGVLWLAHRLLPSFGRDAYLHANFRLQCWWATALFASMKRIFSIDSDVAGTDAIAGGPMLVFARHASTGDTLLPAVLISARHGIVLRWVLKKELLWDPCLDIVGRRLRNCFVDRGGTESAHQVAEVARLADGLGAREGVLIFPEGTRFSTAKRRRALHELEERGESDLLERARALRHVLPPKLGGPIALLQRNLTTDLVLLAHTGFEGVERMSDLFNGALVGRVVRVRFWRIPRSEIPSDPHVLRRWLFDVWRGVDEWIDQVRAAPSGAAAPVTPCP